MKRNNKPTLNSLQEHTKITESPIIGHGRSDGLMGLANDKGDITVFSQEIRRIPNRAQRLDISNQPIRRATQLVADSVRGAVGTSKKTLEIVFKPEIQEGLTEGTYTMMKTTSGEVLADAVDSSGKIVGKARVVESGKLKQLATGAFQIVSIAVAQSHLADIERSLGGIQRSIDQLQNSIDNGFISNIKGPILYLRQVGEKIKNSELCETLSDVQRNTLEGISKEAYTALAKIQEDIKTLTQDTSKIVDKQWLGTDECHGQLKIIANRFEKINSRWTLLIELACLTNIIMTYQDAAGKTHTRIKIDTSEWIQLIENFDIDFERKSNELLNNSVKTNSTEMLTYRRENVQRSVSDTKLESIQASSRYENIFLALQQNSKSLCDGGKEVALAITVDQYGNVEEAAIL